MSVKEIKAIARRWYERWNKGKVAALATMDNICAIDYVLHAGTGPDIHGLKDNKQDTTDVFNAFPDVHFTIDDMIAEGDKVATRWTMTGTHKATNKTVTGWGITIDRIVGGKYMESWVRYDNLSMMQQLGLVPTPQKE